MKNSKAQKEAKRRVVVKGVVTGKSTPRIARAAGTTPRNVQRIAAEPLTQFLITEAFRPQQKKLLAMAARAVQVVQQGFSARRYVKAGKDDYRLRGDAIARLKAVERYADLMEMAQGGKPETKTPGAGGTPSYTWEEFTLLYQSRRIQTDGQDDTITVSPQGDQQSCV